MSELSWFTRYKTVNQHDTESLVFQYHSGKGGTLTCLHLNSAEGGTRAYLHVNSGGGGTLTYLHVSSKWIYVTFTPKNAHICLSWLLAVYCHSCMFLS